MSKTDHDSLTVFQLLAVLTYIKFCEDKVSHYLACQALVEARYTAEGRTAQARLDANTDSLKRRESRLSRLRQSGLPLDHPLILTMEARIVQTASNGQRLREEISSRQQRNMRGYADFEEMIISWAKKLVEARATEAGIDI